MTQEPQDHDLEQVLERIRTWRSEAQNFRNDGYVQQGYRDRIRKALVAAQQALDILENKI